MRAQEPHPQLQAFVEESEDAPAFHELPVEEVRAITDDVFAVEEPEPVGDVIDRTIDGPGGDLSLRIYLPDGEEPFAVTMFFHGGGFVAGGLESHDQFCRTFVNTADVAVVAVDYRLAPEHPFPAAVEDAYAATEWVAENATEFGCDPDELAVAGDSAGGNLAAVVARMARDRGGPDIAYQVLLYPPVSHHQDWDSIDENGEGYFITKADLAWFDEQYFEHEIDAMNVYAAPLLSSDLEGLPPATVVTGGFDPLRDEGFAYVERLEEAGVDVSHYHYDDAIHAFVQLAAEPFEFERSQEVLADIADDLRTALE
ncbi:alpha/beta hydrolase [Natronorubrum halophilum]|uniref:alpha/beta hydrolase n=1 Tax=Natronorubrum halophilum TaxID=1702106 RepID=UPI0010C19B01|nr:alpha/beta hydrolase [Natronorubrum halophilum]